MDIISIAGFRIVELEHAQRGVLVMCRKAHYFDSILNTNKEQTDIYITRDGS